MTPKSADLFGTFLKTVSDNLASGVADASSYTAVPPPAPVRPVASPDTNSANIADRVLKVLRERDGHSMGISELLTVAADGAFPTLSDALSQLQSYGLVTNIGGQIALSAQGVHLAAQAQ